MSDVDLIPPENFLQELADTMVLAGCPPEELLICGGTALALLRFNARPSYDVDVLGLWDPNTGFIPRDAFSPAFTACVREVASAHPELRDLDEKWVNLGPRRIALLGLPAGFEQQLTTRAYGPALTLHILGRLDLIALKLYAAADRFGRRQEVHLTDLRHLKPTFEELDHGVEWIRGLPGFHELSVELRVAVERLGYDDLAQYI
jgi:hypothetical protein